MLTVSRLSTTPIRGFALHHPQSVELSPHGVIDDRRFSMHTADGRLFDRTKLGTLVQLQAEFESVDGGECLTITFPGGETVSGAVELDSPTSLEFHNRAFTARRVIGPWADALSAWADRRLELYRSERLPHERDRNGVSILSEASVAELARQGNHGQPVDPRRFRMLIQVAGAERPHQEDGWLGDEVRIGDALVHVTRLDPRCVITTQDPDTGLRDFPTLHVLRDYRGLRDGNHLYFGVYAEVVEPGRIAVGDPIEVLGG
ncbi:MAG: MOSC domain-containing protein [Chloroflexi bacterium]|nr:MOSC domain-containing protein [Chloroflexota bacterium]